ncbi:hypothetical protein ACVILK_005493 [Bradyrhizobium embrapense]
MSAMLKVVKVVSGILAVVFWLSSFLIWHYYDAQRSTTYLPEAGRIFPLNTHGSIVYLTTGEHHFLCGLTAAGVGFFLSTAVCYFLDRRRATMRNA